MCGLCVHALWCVEFITNIPTECQPFDTPYVYGREVDGVLADRLGQETEERAIRVTIAKSIKEKTISNRSCLKAALKFILYDEGHTRLIFDVFTRTKVQTFDHMRTMFFFKVE